MVGAYVHFYFVMSPRRENNAICSAAMWLNGLIAGYLNRKSTLSRIFAYTDCLLDTIVIYVILLRIKIFDQLNLFHATLLSSEVVLSSKV